jgi:hypothetical protein
MGFPFKQILGPQTLPFAAVDYFPNEIPQFPL